MRFNLENPADAVVEFTSPRTRPIDLGVKWVEYALTNTRLYVIADKSHASPDGIVRVIVGSRRQQTGLEEQSQEILLNIPNMQFPSNSCRPLTARFHPIRQGPQIC